MYTYALANVFQSTTELESAVDRLVKSAKMREKDLEQTEALKMNHSPSRR